MKTTAESEIRSLVGTLISSNVEEGEEGEEGGESERSFELKSDKTLC